MLLDTRAFVVIRRVACLDGALVRSHIIAHNRPSLASRGCQSGALKRASEKKPRSSEFYAWPYARNGD